MTATEDNIWKKFRIQKLYKECQGERNPREAFAAAVIEIYPEMHLNTVYTHYSRLKNEEKYREAQAKKIGEKDGNL